MTIKFPAVATAAITASIILSGCGSAVPTIVSTPLENIDKQPLKTTSLNEVQLKGWGGADIVSDTIPGMSVEKAYTEIIKGKQGQSVIVAVIDSGVTKLAPPSVSIVLTSFPSFLITRISSRHL